MDIFSPKQCFEFKNVLMDLFITNTQDWIPVEYFWIIVMFLSAVWTHSTAPIHSRGSIGEQVM